MNNKRVANPCPLMAMNRLGEVPGQLQSLCIRRFFELCLFDWGVGTLAAYKQDTIQCLQGRRQEGNGCRHSAWVPEDWQGH